MRNNSADKVQQIINKEFDSRMAGAVVNYIISAGWANDLSSYANWLDKYVPSISRILHGICKCLSESDYEDLLKDLADKL